jgi:hypothetical protein
MKPFDGIIQGLKLVIPDQREVGFGADIQNSSNGLYASI